MCASPLSFFRNGPPPPKVALLPDALFFTRSIPVTAGATAAAAGAEVELALEAISPFPLAQLYYGWFWKPGAEHAFAYAAYRRRFTSEQSAAWADAEVVIPVSGALLGAEVGPATTAIVTTPEGLTAVHWERPGVPAKILARVLEPEATDDDRAKAREELIRALGGSKIVIDLPAPPTAEPTTTEGEIVFRSDDFVSRLPTAVSGALDVRDKGDLAALRNARKRDVMLWRVALGCMAALLLLGFGELALVGGKAWQKTRVMTLAARKPKVDKIISSQEVARQISDLVNKRLLPIEMITALVGQDTSPRKPADIVFTKVQTVPTGGIYTLLVEAYTSNPGLISVYESDLRKLPEVENVVVTPLPSRGDRSPFRLLVTFKPDQIKPALSVSE
jgi:hypothetical protein